MHSAGADGRPATKQDASEYLTKQKATVDAGTWIDPDAPPVAPIVPDTGPTFAKFAARFLTDHPGAPRSNHYPSNVSELVKEFGDRPVCEITRADLDAYRVKLQTTARPGRMIPKSKRVEGGRDRLARPPLTPTTVLKRLRALHRMFKMAVRWEVLAVNVAGDLEKPSPNKGSDRFLTREEFDRLEAAAPPWLQPMMRFSVATGMRLKEVAMQRWDAVNLKAMEMSVHQDTKTGARLVPISQEAKAVLEAQHERRKEIGKLSGKLSPFVFAGDDGTPYGSEFGRRRISEVTRQAALSAGLGRGIGFHVLRHTAGSWMAQAGVPLYEIQNVLRHSSPALTQRYAKLQPKHLRSAIKALDKALGKKAKLVSAVAPQGPISVPTRAASAGE